MSTNYWKPQQQQTAAFTNACVRGLRNTCK